MTGGAVSGNHLPKPIPQRVRRHSSHAQRQLPHTRRSREHARGRPVWQCRLATTAVPWPPHEPCDGRAAARRVPAAGHAAVPHRPLEALWPHATQRPAHGGGTAAAGAEPGAKRGASGRPGQAARRGPLRPSRRPRRGRSGRARLRGPCPGREGRGRAGARSPAPGRTRAPGTTPGAGHPRPALGAIDARGRARTAAGRGLSAALDARTSPSPPREPGGCPEAPPETPYGPRTALAALTGPAGRRGSGTGESARASTGSRNRPRPGKAQRRPQPVPAPYGHRRPTGPVPPLRSAETNRPHEPPIIGPDHSAKPLWPGISPPPRALRYTRARDGGRVCAERTERPEAGGRRTGPGRTRPDPGRAPGRAYGKVVRRGILSVTQTHPSLFSQLPSGGEPLVKWPVNPLATSEERTNTAVRTLRGRAMPARPTSTRGPRVERFVIECFAPSCLVDIAADGELVTPTPRNTVDSIMSIEGWGPVQNRGESCRSERPDKNGETRTPRGA